MRTFFLAVVIFPLHNHLCHLTKWRLHLEKIIWDFYSADTETGTVGRRLSNHDVFGNKIRILKFFFANGPISFLKLFPERSGKFKRFFKIVFDGCIVKSWIYWPVWKNLLFSEIVMIGQLVNLFSSVPVWVFALWNIFKVRLNLIWGNILICELVWASVRPVVFFGLFYGFKTLSTFSRLRFHASYEAPAYMHNVWYTIKTRV